MRPRHHRHGCHGGHGPGPCHPHVLHHHHGPRWHPRSLLAWYTRVSLRRRLFRWFGAAIILSGLAVAAVLGLSGQWSAHWRAERRGASLLLADQLSEVWAVPARRDALAKRISDRLGLAVVLEDSSHRKVGTFGAPEGHALLSAQVKRSGEVLGFVSVLPDRRNPSHAWTWVLVVLAVLAVLWAVAGGVSRRLARPFDALARVAEDLGAGRLDSRVPIGPRDRGETRLLARVLNDMAERIERQIADHRELLAGVSHELRTPLARIRLLVELGRTREGKPETLAEIDREVVEMDALVDQLLVSSRLDFQTLARRPLSAESLARRALERAGVSEAMLEDSADGAEVEGDATLLGRALANLIDNAQRHGGGLERLSVRVSEEAVRFAAKDAGPGFAADEEKRIFEPFYRGEADDGEAPRGKVGLGLGLSLVRRIAEAHGGQAFARNLPEGGAEVGFLIPTHAAPAEAAGV